MTYLTLPQIGRRIPIPAEQTILQLALEAGVPYPHGCRSGRCGSCKSRLISGDVELGKHSPFALTEEDRTNGLILACRSVPTTDVTVEWLGVDYAAMPGAPARHYSMASRPDDELVELHVRLVPGGRTSSLIPPANEGLELPVTGSII